jgi:hypothetical protein
MSEAPYREMPDVLGESEREEEATRKLGAWRDRTRTSWLAMFAVAGVGLAGLGYWALTELQFHLYDGWANVRISVVGAVLPFVACLFVGRFIGNRVVSARMDAEVTRLSAAYEIPRERLAQTARLIAGI